VTNWVVIGPSEYALSKAYTVF